MRYYNVKLKKHSTILLVAAVALLLPWLNISCEKELSYLDDNTVRLEFDTDTLTFDTVFTTLGSTTKRVKVYNPYRQAVMIGSVTVGGGRESRFRLNVDGDTSLVARNVEIAAGDSIFIFVHANIDPQNSASPLEVRDSIVFGSKSGSRQHLQLRAWGRDAVYHQPDTAGRPYLLECTGWDHSRPHVIYGIACVDSLETLSLNPGDELHFAPNSYLIVLDGASLVAQGVAGNPVVFTSLRHDGWYDFLPGQWGYIQLMAGSHDNVVNHAIIENAAIGIVADTNVGANPTLRISNTVVRHCSEGGILGRGSWIDGKNLLVYTCGIATLSMQMGGRYTFSQSTFANYWRYGSRSNPGVILNNWYISAYGDTVARNLVEATFTNCIIYGSYDKTELWLDNRGGGDFNYRFLHSVVKGGEWNVDPQFVNPDDEDFHLADDSPASGIGYQFND